MKKTFSWKKKNYLWQLVDQNKKLVHDKKLFANVLRRLDKDGQKEYLKNEMKQMKPNEAFEENEEKEEKEEKEENEKNEKKKEFLEEDTNVKRKKKEKVLLFDVPMEESNDFCKACHTILAVTEEGFLACTNSGCGRLFTDIVDYSAEWRFYGAEDNNHSDPARCGLPINPLLQESSFGCKILAGKMSYEMQKIKRYTEWQATPYKEKQQYNDFQYITDMAQKAGITKIIIDDALTYRKQISEYEVTYRGDNRDGIIAASIYLSCRKNNAPRSAQEIAKIFHLNDSSATKGCKNAMLIIQNMEKHLDATEKTTFCRTTPNAFLYRSCSLLNMSQEIEKLCYFVSQKIESLNEMSENTPQSIAAGILFFVVTICRLPIEKKLIAKTSNISPVTITNCYKNLFAMRELLVPNMLLQKYQWVPS